jgi:hypothetical protein
MEILCARFQDSNQRECLAIWTPNGTTSNLEELEDLYARLSEHLSQPIIFYGWLTDGRMHPIGRQEIIDDLQSSSPEKLIWKMVRLRSQKPKATRTFRQSRIALV